MTDSFKLRTFSGWSILLLGVLLVVTAFLPVVMRGSLPPAAWMIGLFGLLAIAVGIPLSVATGARLREEAARNLCVLLESLTLGAAGGIVGCFVQRSALFSALDPLHATLAILFVALFCFAALARVTTERQGAAAFLSSSSGLFSRGGSVDPVAFLVLQPPLLVLAAVAARVLAAQTGDGREASLLALVLSFAVLPIFVRAEVALCVKRSRDTTTAWPSYGALLWAALLGLVAFPEILGWSLALPGLLLGSNPPPAWPQVAPARAICYLVSLAACSSCYLASRRVRRGLPWRAASYVALGLGSLLPVTVGLASGGIYEASPIPTPIVLALSIVLPAVLIVGAHRLLFSAGEKLAAPLPMEASLGVTSPVQVETA